MILSENGRVNTKFTTILFPILTQGNSSDKALQQHKKHVNSQGCRIGSLQICDSLCFNVFLCDFLFSAIRIKCRITCVEIFTVKFILDKS